MVRITSQLNTNYLLLLLLLLLLLYCQYHYSNCQSYLTARTSRKGEEGRGEERFE